MSGRIRLPRQSRRMLPTAGAIQTCRSRAMLPYGGSSPKNRQSRALQLKPGKAASHRAEHLDILNVYG